LLDKENPAEMIVDVDKSKIRQVFANFIDNSIKYSKEKGKVTVGCSRKNNECAEKSI
jgi:signal transduction histidine kinase